jgi:hypothetical protein
VVEEEIIVIIFLLVVVKVHVDSGLIKEGNAQSRQCLIPVVVPVASTGGIVVIKITYPEKTSVVKEKDILGYTNQIIDAVPFGGMVDDVVVKIFILKSVLQLGKKI